MSLSNENLIEMMDFYNDNRELYDDKELFDIMTTKYDLNFGQCSQFDYLLTGKHCGGYWRSAYNFPKEGDEFCSGTVKAGLFTFGTK